MNLGQLLTKCNNILINKQFFTKHRDKDNTIDIRFLRTRPRSQADDPSLEAEKALAKTPVYNLFQ